MNYISLTDDFGEDAKFHCVEIACQLTAILMGWGLAIDDELKGKP